MSSAFPAANLTLGQANALVKKLGGMDLVNKILSDAAKVTVDLISHIINGDADPFIPDGWKVEDHRKQGELKLTRDGDNLYLNGQKIDFFLSEGQQGDKSVQGHKLRKELADKPVLNATVLDHLIKNPTLIPDSWKGKAVFFWGTIYRHSDGDLCVRYLYWSGVRWHWYCGWLDDGWLSDGPAAVLQVSA